MTPDLDTLRTVLWLAVAVGVVLLYVIACEFHPWRRKR